MSREICVGLILGYGFNRVDHRTPDQIGRTALFAAQAMYQAGEIDKIVFAAGRVNLVNPLVGESFYQHFRVTYPKVPESDLICDPVLGGSSTRYELKHLRELMLRYSWQRAKAICCRPHFPRVSRNISRICGLGQNRVEAVDFQRYLSSPQFNGCYHSQLVALINSSDYHEFLAVEGFERALIDVIPWVGPFLLDLWAKMVPNKGELLYSYKRKMGGR